MKWVRLSLLAFFSIFSLLACAGSAGPAIPPVAFTIDMTEYAFNPVQLEAKVGQQVTINLVNKGQLAHEIMFGREVKLDGGIPAGYHTDLFQAAGVMPTVTGKMEGEHGHGGVMVVVEKTGEQASISFTATEKMLGEWEMGCFEQDGVHYIAGMVGKFIVSQ